MPKTNISQLWIKWIKNQFVKCYWCFSFNITFMLCSESRKTDVSQPAGLGASLPFKSAIVNRWKVYKQMTGAITMWNWLRSQLLKAHHPHYSFYAALWWQKAWIAHQDYNMFVFRISLGKGISAAAGEARGRGWAGTDPHRKRNGDSISYR